MYYYNFSQKGTINLIFYYSIAYPHIFRFVPARLPVASLLLALTVSLSLLASLIRISFSSSPFSVDLLNSQDVVPRPLTLLQIEVKVTPVLEEVF